MQRYRAYGQEDDQPLVVGDEHFIGVDEYSNPENVQPAYVQQAVNADFTSLNAETRGGFVCLPELGKTPFGHKWTYNAIDGSVADFYDVSYGQGLFVAVGLGGAIYSSPDAITWTARTAPTLPNFSDIAFANGTFVAVGSLTGGSSTPVCISSDGITWSTPATPITLSVTGVAYGNGIWVVVGNKRSWTSSDNGNTWVTHTGINDLEFVQGVSFGNGVFSAVTAIGLICISTDGVTWTTVIPSYVGGFLDVSFGNQVFVALAGNGAVYTSPDAINWTLTRAADGRTWSTITYGNGVFVAASASFPQVTMYSIDATNWIVLPGAPSYTWYGSTFGNGQFVVVGAAGASMTSNSIAPAVYASAIYSDPQQIGTNWIMVAGSTSVGFYAFGHTSRSVSLNGNTINTQSTIVQANNYVYIFRGDNATPLYWNGDWNTSFAVVPPTSLPATYNSVPNSNQATYYQNRLWVRSGKDSVAASDVLAFTDYDPLANEFNLNTGNSDYVVATFPFAQNSLICFKNKSIELMQNVEGSLSDVTVTEITRQVGLVGINAVTSVGPDLAYVSYGNINLLTLTTTNNSLQHKTLPLSARIRRIMNRVNWNVGYKISIGYWNNKIYVSLPLDNSLFCNAVVVYNFINESWYGEWNFSPDMNMCIQGWAVNDYLGLQRLHAITEDGRIFVTDEGQNDISGTTVSEISFDLVTRAYHLDEATNERRGASYNHFQRRMYADLSTNRPQVSVASFTDGASEESTLLTNQTYTRSQSWLFNDDAYDLTNANNDYNRPYRRDYSTGPASVQCGSGFLPEMRQDIRIPLITRRQGRLSWLEVTNTQGYLMLKSIGFENRAGQRSSYVQA